MCGVGPWSCRLPLRQKGIDVEFEDGKLDNSYIRVIFPAIAALGVEAVPEIAEIVRGCLAMEAMTVCFTQAIHRPAANVAWRAFGLCIRLADLLQPFDLYGCDL